MHESIKNFCIGILLLSNKTFFFSCITFSSSSAYNEQVYKMEDAYFLMILSYHNVFYCLMTTITQSISIYTEWFNKNYHLNYISEIWQTLLTKVVQYKETIVWYY